MRDEPSKPPQERTTELQSKLYQAAKRDPRRRFHAVYDRLSVSYVLQAAWQQVRQNDGAAGIDQQTLEEIEALGVAPFLAEIAQALREKTYRPPPVRRVETPKDDGRTRPLGIPTVRDRVVQAAAKLPGTLWVSRSSRRTLRERLPLGSVRGWVRRKRWRPCPSTPNRVSVGGWMRTLSSSSTSWITSS